MTDDRAFLGAPPYPGARLRQSSPGAPPTWTLPRPARQDSPTLGVIAVVLAVLGLLIGLAPYAGLVLTWPFLLAALVLAVLALRRRGADRGLGIAALVVTVGSAGLSVLWGGGYLLFAPLFDGAPEESSAVPSPPPLYDSDPPAGGVPSLETDLSAGGATRGDALPFGTEITVTDGTSGEDVWVITARALESVPAGALAPGDPVAENGAYLAAPVELTNISGRTLDLSAEFEYSPRAWLLTGDGGRAYPALVGGSTSYPTVWQDPVIEPGETVTSYELYDVSPTVVGTGFTVLDLLSGEQVYWGPPRP